MRFGLVKARLDVGFLVGNVLVLLNITLQNNHGKMTIIIQQENGRINAEGRKTFRQMMRKNMRIFRNLDFLMILYN